MQFPFNNAMQYTNGAFSYGTPMIYSSTAVGLQYSVNGMPTYTQDSMMGLPIDPKQRIDNWRQGIVG